MAPLVPALFKDQLYIEFIRRVKSQGSDSSPGVGRKWVRVGTCDIWRGSRASWVACGPAGKVGGGRSGGSGVRMPWWLRQGSPVASHCSLHTRVNSQGAPRVPSSVPQTCSPLEKKPCREGGFSPPPCRRREGKGLGSGLPGVQDTAYPHLPVHPPGTFRRRVDRPAGTSTEEEPLNSLTDQEMGLRGMLATSS